MSTPADDETSVLVAPEASTEDDVPEEEPQIIYHGILWMDPEPTGQGLGSARQRDAADRAPGSQAFLTWKTKSEQSTQGMLTIRGKSGKSVEFDHISFDPRQLGQAICLCQDGQETGVVLSAVQPLDRDRENVWTNMKGLYSNKDRKLGLPVGRGEWVLKKCDETEASGTSLGEEIEKQITQRFKSWTMIQPDGNIYRGWAIGISKGGRLLMLTIAVLLTQVLGSYFIWAWGHRYYDNERLTLQPIWKVYKESAAKGEHTFKDASLGIEVFTEGTMKLIETKVLGTLFLLLIFFSADLLLLRADVSSDRLIEYVNAFTDEETSKQKRKDVCLFCGGENRWYKIGKVNMIWLWIDAIANSVCVLMICLGALPLFLMADEDMKEPAGLKDFVMDSFGLLFLATLDDFSGQIEFGVETGDFDDIMADMHEEFAKNKEKAYWKEYGEYLYGPEIDPVTNKKRTWREKRETRRANSYRIKSVQWQHSHWAAKHALEEIPTHDATKTTCHAIRDFFAYGSFLYTIARFFLLLTMVVEVPLFIILQVQVLPEGQTSDIKHAELRKSMFERNTVQVWFPIAIIVAGGWMIIRAAIWFYDLHRTSDHKISDVAVKDPGETEQEDCCSFTPKTKDFLPWPDYNDPGTVGERDFLAFVFLVVLRRPDPRGRVHDLRW